MRLPLMLMMLMMLGLLLPAAAMADGLPPISGHIKRLDDGDSFVLSDGTHIRLQGIDAPERRQTCQRAGGQVYACGLEAKNYLDAITHGREVECEAVTIDKYHRTVAHCHTGTGTGRRDIGRRMVRAGWAVAYRKYSEKYVEQESAARAEKAGIWQGRFIQPASFRH